MNRIITNDASPIKFQPLVADGGTGSIPFLQDSVQEAISSLTTGLIGGYTTDDLIVLYGVVHTITGGGNTDTWTAGAIYYNGEVYTVDAGTVTKTGGQTFVFYPVNTFHPTLDPIKFTDNSANSVHQIRKIIVAAGTSGSGIADYNEVTVKLLYSIIGSNWISVASGSLSHGWTWGTSGYFSYKKDLLGNVHVKGLVNSPGSSTSLTLYTLPAGFCPSPNIGLPVVPFSVVSQFFVAYQGFLEGNGNIQIKKTDSSAPDTNTDFSFYFVFSTTP